MIGRPARRLRRCRPPASTGANVYRSPLIPAVEHQRADRGRRHPRPARAPPAPAWPRASSSTPPPPASRSACSAPPPRSCSASTRSSPASGSGPADMWLLRGRDPQAGRARPGHRLLACWSASRSPSSTSASTATPTTIYVKATDQPGQRGRQPARRAGQPGGPERGRRPPALGRAGRPGRRQGRVQHPVPRPGRGRAAGRRDRRGQHHGHLRARTPHRDRAAPRAGRHPRAHPHPVPGRGDPARPARRRGRRRRRRGRHRRLRAQPKAGPWSSRPGLGRRPRPPRCSSAPLAGLLPALARRPPVPHRGAAGRYSTSLAWRFSGYSRASAHR